MAAMMESFVDKVVQIVTNDGRNIVGVLKGFDQTTNVVLDECHERVFSSSSGVEQACAGACFHLPCDASDIGVTLAYGRSAVVGEIDEEADAQLDLNEMMAEPLKPVVH
ncbi:hypothetical protein AB1Y20_003731 [Prymnesium parvum]|uniref:U6 snRNA-associated Sm-like protein LSm8 n=1 Tax=Prymnesium parvum TaxID=97485 RepID=A0AB34J7N2_PRYPA